MAEINAEMKELLEGTDIWVLATADRNGVPNAVPIFYKKVLGEDRLMLVDNFMKKTIANIKENPAVSISVWNEKKGFQFKGTAVEEKEGNNFDIGNGLVKDSTPKGVVVVNIEEVYSTTPGPEAGNKVA